MDRTPLRRRAFPHTTNITVTASGADISFDLYSVLNAAGNALADYAATRDAGCANYITAQPVSILDARLPRFAVYREGHWSMDALVWDEATYDTDAKKAAAFEGPFRRRSTSASANTTPIRFSDRPQRGTNDMSIGNTLYDTATLGAVIAARWKRRRTYWLAFYGSEIRFDDPNTSTSRGSPRTARNRAAGCADLPKVSRSYLGSREGAARQTRLRQKAEGCRFPQRASSSVSQGFGGTLTPGAAPMSPQARYNGGPRSSVTSFASTARPSSVVGENGCRPKPRSNGKVMWISFSAETMFRDRAGLVTRICLRGCR